MLVDFSKTNSLLLSYKALLEFCAANLPEVANIFEVEDHTVQGLFPQRFGNEVLLTIWLCRSIDATSCAMHTVPSPMAPYQLPLVLWTLRVVVYMRMERKWLNG